MKRACLITAIWGLLPTAAFAAPCVPGSLASYVLLGGGGCNIGSALFFGFADLGAQGGATPIPDPILVNPVTAGGPGLRFDVNSSAGPGQIFERVIGYSLSGPGFVGGQVALGGNTVSVDGAVTAVEKVCLGAAFGPGPFCFESRNERAASSLDIFP